MSKNPSQQDLIFIDSDDALQPFCDAIRDVEWLALDTEFLRERTYRPELALVQISAAGHLACIDPLAISNLEPLLDTLYNPNITKVLHAAGQDLEILYWLRGSVPENLFDTQIAAPLLGYQEQLGYGNLVREVLGVELAKTHARADWMRRPLPEVQLQYAADDVIYLAQLYPIMRDKLESLGRLQWLERDWQDLTQPQLYEKPPEQMWLKLRQVNNLKGARLAIAQQLASWREVTARERNLPRNWLIKDAVLLDLARQMPTDIGELKHIRGLSDGAIRQHGKTLTAIIQRARNEAPQAADKFVRKGSLSVTQEAAADVLEAIAKLHASELQINASVLAPRKSIEHLVQGNTNTMIMNGWRHELIGQTLSDLLSGSASLSFSAGNLQIGS